MNAKELSVLLANSADRVVRELLPGGKKQGAEWVCGSVRGEAGESLSVRLTGEKAGVWKDFATDEAGDLLDLWSAAKGVSLAEAIAQAKDWLGIREPRLESARVYPKPKRPEIESPKGPVMQWLTETRKLAPEAVKAYRVASKDGRYAVFPFLRDGELINYKARSISDKRDMRTAKGAEPCLFGWQAIPDNARSVTICEGELDCLSLWQYGHPALSVFSGAQNLTWIETEYQRLERFSEIFLCLDSDEAGQNGALRIVERLGRERCRMVRLPHKDANECLVKGVPKAEIDAAFAAADYLQPPELRSAAAYTDEVIAEFYPPDGDPMGVLLPWQSTHRNIQLRTSELSVWTGVSGHGKSQILGQIMLYAADQGDKVCIASLEIRPRKTLRRLVRQATAMSEPSIPYIRQVMQWLGTRVWVFDQTGKASLESVLSTFRYARRRFGVSQFVIDNLTMLDVAEDDFEGQHRLVQELIDFKNEFDCHLHLVAHARKGADETRAPRKLDVKGSGAITQLADNVFSVWRNKAKEEGADASAPDAMLYCDKQRDGEWEGSIALWFDVASFQYREREHGKPSPIVPFTRPEESAGVGEMVEF